MTMTMTSQTTQTTEKSAERPVRLLGVLGAGQMGGGIAQVAAERGIPVILLDATLELAQQGLRRIDAALGKLVEKGKITAEQRQRTTAAITATTGHEALSGCDFVIEAATENKELKRRLFAELSQRLDKDAVLASNTSSISITLLASATAQPGQVIGMHFMNPVPLMKLVEVVRGLGTSEATYERTMALGRFLGKEVVTAKDMPGFIVNRLLIPFLNEACFALQESLGTAKDIDTGIKLGLNHPMGPFELADLIGLDTCLSIAEVLHGELGEDKYRPAPLLRQYVAAGYLGRKSGRGFYTY